MSERNDPSRSTPAPIPLTSPRSQTSEVMAQGLQNLPPPPTAVEDDVRRRIAVLEREVKALGADPASAALFHEMGLLWEDALHNPRNAAVAFQNAYRLAPRFLVNIRAARRLFSDVGNWQMVLQLLDAELAATEDTRLKATLLYEKAGLLEERLSRHEDATTAYQQCLDLKPQDVALLVQLESVYAARGDHASLVQVYRDLAAALEEPPLKAHYLTCAGMVLEDRLQQPEPAAALYREAFQLHPGDLLLLSALKRAAEREGNMPELVQTLGAEAQLLGPQGAPAYLQLSKLHERLGQPDEALQALLAARAASPAEPLVLSALAAIYESQGRFEDLADVLLAWLGSINDESELIAVNLRLAALNEETLKRDDAAIARYQAILARVPGHTAALAGLGKLYFRQQDWEGSLQVLEAEIRTAEDAKQKAAKVYKAAQTLEEKLNRAEEAISRYQLCLQILPGYLPAQKALTRLFERQHRYSELASMFEQDLLQPQDKDQSLATLNKIASIYEDRLSDLDRTVDCYKRILELAPNHLPTLRNLARVYERAGRWQDLIQINELEATLASDIKQVLSLHHHSAEIFDEQLKDRPGAIALYERLLTLLPSYLPALTNLGRLYAQDGRWDELIRMYRSEAEIASSPWQAATLIAKVGELYETRLQNENEAIASYQEVLTLAPNYFPALRALGRIYRAQSAWENLVEILRSEAASRTDPMERANALFQASAIWEDQLNRPELAVQGYEEVLKLTPAHPAALRALERLYADRGDVKSLVAVLDRATQTSLAPAEKAIAYLKLARIYLDRVEEPSRAAQCCEAALALEPGNLVALTTLERIRASDRARRAELKSRFAEKLPDGQLKNALHLSSVLDQDTMAPEMKVMEFRRAFVEDPGNARLVFALERALRQAGDYRGLGLLFERALATATHPEERQELAIRIADISEFKTDELPKALAHYRLALGLSPRFLPALQGVRRVCLALGEYAEARVAYEEEGRAARDVRGALEAYLAAGKLCVEKLNDLDGGAANFRRALERDPLDPVASEGLEQILASRGGTEDLALLHERRAEAKLAQKNFASAADEFHAAARIWMDGAKRREPTLVAVERALAAQPTHPAALELKGELSLQDHQYADAAAAFSARVQQGGDARTLAALHLKLGALYQDHLSDASRAAAHLQTSLSGDPRNTEALDRLAQIHATARNWTGAVDCLHQLIELERDPRELARHHLALAQIFDEGFGDATQAGALYRKALELTPDDDAIVERLVALFERSGNLPALVEMLEHQALRAPDAPRVLQLRLKAGDLAARALSDIPRALANFRAVTALDPGSIAGHVALADLYMRDAAAAPAAILEHRTLLKLEPARFESLHALFRLWEGQRAVDRAFCAAGVLQFFHAATDAESAFYAALKDKLPAESLKPLGEAEFSLITHPEAWNPIPELLRAMGDGLTKLYPPGFEAVGVDRKADRLKPDHPVHRAIRAVASLLQVEEFDVYQARRGLMTLETTEPLSVCVGQDVVRKFNPREQRFLIGRAVMGLRNKTALFSKTTRGELTDLLGNVVRIHEPGYEGMGKRSDESSKQLRKVLSRKALKTLEAPSHVLANVDPPDVEATVMALEATANRVGLLLSGDVASALGVLLREDAGTSSVVRSEGPEGIVQVVRQRQDLRLLLEFALSDEFFQLRQKLGPALGAG